MYVRRCTRVQRIIIFVYRRSRSARHLLGRCCVLRACILDQYIIYNVSAHLARARYRRLRYHLDQNKHDIDLCLKCRGMSMCLSVA